MFKVEITRIDSITKVVGQKYQVIGQKPIDPDDVPLSQKEAFAGKLVDEYGYPPPREEEVTVETKVFEQTINDMDLSEVIKAINGL